MSELNPEGINVVRLTPPGRGAVASLLVEGAGAVRVLDGLFHAKNPRSELAPGDRLLLGRFADRSATAHVGEDVVVRCRGEESLELHCHGGTAAVERIEQALAGRGCRIVDWRDWIDGGGERDPIRAEARRALAQAETAQTASVLLDQYQGALGRSIKSILASLDQKDAFEAKREIEALLAWADFGRHLAEPWRVVLAGRPNVGKSTLINALVGYNRAIVHHLPGTTRDVLTAATAMEGWPVVLADTAGLRATDHPIERAGVQLAEEELQASDLVLLLFDASRPWSEDDRRLATDWPSALLVYNKIDLAEIHTSAPRPQGFLTSAIEGRGIVELATEIGRRLVPQRPPARAGVPFTSRQADALRASLECVAKDDLAAAGVMLGLLLSGPE